MTFPSTTSAAIANDPDPTTQMAWPTSKNYPSPSPSPVEPTSQSSWPPQGPARANGKSPARGNKKDDIPEGNSEIGTRRLSTLQLFNLSISMAGAQVAWTVELG